MEKDKALDLLKLDPDATPEAVNARYKQVIAFLSCDGDTPAALQGLLAKANDIMTSAYDALPHTAADKAAPPDTGAKPAVMPPTTKEFLNKLKQLVFPNAGMPAGEPLSDQWWEVYRRPVLVALALMALGLCYIPDINFEWPQPRPEPSPQPIPTPEPPPGPTPTPEPTPTPTPTPEPTPAPWPPKPDPSLIPQPNPNPIIIDPTQDPTKFLFGLFDALKRGDLVQSQSFIKQPESVSVSMMRFSKHDACPEYYFQIPTDAMTVVSRTTGNATIRVKEKYFTGQPKTNDYYLVSDNGVWRLAQVESVSVPDAGDPVSFLYDHIALCSRMTFHQAYDNLDADFKSRISFEDFKQDYGYSWFVPRRSALSLALTVESQAPDAEHPTEVTLRLIPSYFTMRQIKTWDGKEADLLFDLVNEDGKWRIHDIRRVVAPFYRR